MCSQAYLLKWRVDLVGNTLVMLLLTGTQISGWVWTDSVNYLHVFMERDVNLEHSYYLGNNYSSNQTTTFGPDFWTIDFNKMHSFNHQTINHPRCLGFFKHSFRNTLVHQLDAGFPVKWPWWMRSVMANKKDEILPLESSTSVWPWAPGRDIVELSAWLFGSWRRCQTFISTYFNNNHQ